MVPKWSFGAKKMLFWSNNPFCRRSLPKAMSIIRSELLRRKKEGENVKVMLWRKSFPKAMSICRSEILRGRRGAGRKCQCQCSRHPLGGSIAGASKWLREAESLGLVEGFYQQDRKLWSYTSLKLPPIHQMTYWQAWGVEKLLLLKKYNKEFDITFMLS